MKKTIPQIDVEAAKARLDKGDALFVDVRDPHSFASAHIPGALHLTDETVEEFVAKGDRAKTVIVYCYHGNSSLGGAAFLLEQGFADVFSMAGGFEAWRGVFEHEARG